MDREGASWWVRRTKGEEWWLINALVVGETASGEVQLRDQNEEEVAELDHAAIRGIGAKSLTKHLARRWNRSSIGVVSHVHG